jgi:hypothetical protein
MQNGQNLPTKQVFGEKQLTGEKFPEQFLSSGKMAASFPAPPCLPKKIVFFASRSQL